MLRPTASVPPSGEYASSLKPSICVGSCGRTQGPYPTVPVVHLCRIGRSGLLKGMRQVLTLIEGFGRYIYAIGGNPEAAKLSGIKVAQVQLAAYMISGLLAGLAGVLFVAQYRQGKPDAGSGLELDAIAAVVIGGTSLMGGRGGLAGTFVGVLIFGLLSDILQLQNIDSNVQLLMKGLIIVGTVLVQEQNLGQLLTRWRGQAPRPPPTRTGSVEAYRPSQVNTTSKTREDIHEAS